MGKGNHGTHGDVTAQGPQGSGTHPPEPSGPGDPKGQPSRKAYENGYAPSTVSEQLVI